VVVCRRFPVETVDATFRVESRPHILHNRPDAVVINILFTSLEKPCHIENVSVDSSNFCYHGFTESIKTW